MTSPGTHSPVTYFLPASGAHANLPRVRVSQLALAFLEGQEGAFRARGQCSHRRPDCRFAHVGPCAGSPRFPGDPSCAFASGPGPRPNRRSLEGLLTVPSMAAPTRTTERRLQRINPYWGYRAASAPAAYASRMVLPPPMQSSLPAGWLAFTGGSSNPLDHYKRFQITLWSPILDLSWRNVPAGFPGHPLLDATINITLERHRDLLRCGFVLVDENDFECSRAYLFYLEHAIQDASRTRSGDRRVVSKRMLYVEIDSSGNARHMNYAPYLDYRPLVEGEPGIEPLLARPECAWIGRDLEQKAQGYAIAHVVPEHLDEVRSRKLDLIAKTEAAVKDRLTKEISYWDHRAEQLKAQEAAGKLDARLNSGEAQAR